MPNALRLTRAVLAGLITAFVLVILVEIFSAIVYPTPPDFKGTMEEMCLHVQHYPPWILALVVPLWAGTAYIGTWIAGRLGNLFSAWVVGILLLLAVVFNVSSLPYAAWFKGAILMAVPLAIILAGQTVLRRKPPFGDTTTSN